MGNIVNPYSFTDPNFNISNASYNGSYNYGGVNPDLGIAIKPDGTKFYIVDGATDEIRQYSITDGDITTLSYDNKAADASSWPINTAFSLNFKPDGTEVYLTMTFGTRYIHMWPLTTAWDISTCGVFSGETFTPSAQETDFKADYIKPDGSKLYVGGGNSTIYQYSTSAAWVITSSTYDSVSTSFSDEIQAIRISDDGKRLHVFTEADDILQYDLSTPWDITSKTNLVTYAAQGSGLIYGCDMTVCESLRKFYTYNSFTENIYEYDY